MLNYSFPRQCTEVSPYVAPTEIATRVMEGNQDFQTGPERRLQAVYTEEIWLKLVRAGLPPEVFNGSSVLEVCAGTGYLTYHLLQRCQPKSLTVNDISSTEMDAARQLIGRSHPHSRIDWVVGDVGSIDFDRCFDIIIGNSFLHHLPDVPAAMSRFVAILNQGGVFISLHEPTPMAIAVEGAKLVVYPLAVVAPRLVNDIARARYKGPPSRSDLWIFESAKIKWIALQSGFVKVAAIPWGLARTIVVQRHNMHLSEAKPVLKPKEEKLFRRAVYLDEKLNHFLPARCFGSLTLICKV